MFFPVSALCRKLKKATAALKVAQKVFLDITAAADEGMVAEWKLRERKAMRKRLEDREVMAIYELSAKAGKF
jgi:hypothetical protein